jgi:hypothetical protein
MGKRGGLTMVHINNDHLVALALDFTQSLVWYGNSFSKAAVKEVTSVIDWWTFHHTTMGFCTES